jgi:hypothetical protein
VTFCTDISLGTSTQVLIQAIQDLDITIAYKEAGASMSLVNLTRLLHQCAAVNDTTKKKTRIQLMSLRTALLTDLHASLNVTHSAADKLKKTSWSTWLKFIALICAGILVVACQSFDALTSLLGVLSLPAGIIFLAGFSFAILSIVIFCSINLVQIAANLDIKLRDVPYLLNLYVTQKEHIQAIRMEIDNYCLAQCSLEDLKTIEQLVAELKNQFKSVCQDSKQFNTALSSHFVRATQLVFSCMSGILFFGGGYFAAQSVAVIFLSLFLSVVSPVFWPVIVFSVIVGIASLIFCWHIELPGMNRVISSWFGLDEDKIESLCHEELIHKEDMKLNNLISKVQDTYALKSRIKEPNNEVCNFEKKDVTFKLSSINLGFYHKKIVSQKNDEESPQLKRTNSCNW